ncbi:MAG: DNA polymerase III subunit delta [Cyclobacteriaceae bacterium]|nr:DNA polymerase III subunit delta [Cyclobacteriaceae bacterium]
MPQTAEAILKKLENNEYAPVYFLFGSESYYIDLITEYINKNALTESEKGFNQMILYGRDITIPDLLSQARRFPMMSERQVVIVREAQEIRDWNKPEGENQMNAYITNPLPSTILVIAYKNKSPDKRKTLFKNFEKYAVTVESNKLYDNQLPEWVDNYVVEMGHSIDLKAAYLLVENIGNDLVRLSNEINKILINYKEKVEINPGIVQKYVGISKDYNSFELQRAIGVRDVVKSNRIVNYFSSNSKNNPVIPTIALLFGFFSKLLIIHSTSDRNPRNLSAITGVNSYFIREYIHATQNFTLPKVIENIHYIREADLRSKGVGVIHVHEGEILKELVYKLLH